MPRPLDLVSWQFWSILLLGLILLTPVIRPSLRKWLLALLNLLFLYFLLGVYTVVVVVAIGLVTMLARRGLPAFLVVGATLLFFVGHKLPGLVPVASFNPLLAAIGYSFLALRVLDLTRAVVEERQSAPDLISCINYLAPFHMLAAGPIQTYDEFCRQPPVPEAPDYAGVLNGLDRIAQGLFKKLVVAQTLDRIFLSNFQNPDQLYTFIEIQIYYIWVYLDFSAYSDIAVGTGKLLGLQTPENFRSPLLARDIIDFWERWHISLSKFIRFHLFIPVQLTLARSWKSRWPLLSGAVAYLVSFGLCGLWHGFGFKFLIWGLYHAVGLIVCKAYQEAMLQRWGRKGRKAYLANQPIRWIMTAITFEFVAISLWLIA